MDMNPWERRQKILEALCLRRHDTYGNLAHEFNVSTGTIRRDIVVLTCSYPIETVKGGHGGVRVAEIIEDDTELTKVYNPDHPDADEQGYVMMPNVDPVKETVDAMSATRSYEANITAFNAMKLMAQRALDIGK